MTPDQQEILDRVAKKDWRYKHRKASTPRPTSSSRSKPAAIPLCVLRGDDTGERVQCPTCRGKVELKVFACKVHPEGCTIDRAVEGKVCCAGCKNRQDRRADANSLIFDQGGTGIGDGLLGLFAVVAAKHASPDRHIEYRVGGSARAFVELFDGYDSLALQERRHNEFPATGAVQLNLGYSEECHSRMIRTRLERYCANAGVAKPMMPRLRDPDRIRSLGCRYAGTVALAPFSLERRREYPLHAWLSLEAILRDAGYRTVVLHSEISRTERFQGEKLIAQPADVVAGVLLNALACVGSDSGMAHLSGLLGTPTVVLDGPSRADRIFDAYPSIVVVKGTLACTGCCGHEPKTAECNTVCASLAGIDPARVLAEVDRVQFAKLTSKAVGDVLFLDDLPNRWARFRPHYPQAVWAQTREQFEAALGRPWDLVCFDHDICDGVPGDREKWNGVEAAKLFLAAGTKAGRVLVHSTNRGGAARIRDTLATGGVVAELTPFDSNIGGKCVDSEAWKSRLPLQSRSLLSPNKLAVIRDAVLATNHLAGDVAELGVYKGGSAKLIAHYAAGATVHLFDTFTGLPEDDAHGEHGQGDFRDTTLADVEQFLAGSKVAIHRGIFPFTADDATRYRFVHLDADTYQSTAAALRYFMPRMTPGGRIVLDDYGWWCTPGVGKALHELLPSGIHRASEYQALVVVNESPLPLVPQTRYGFPASAKLESMVAKLRATTSTGEADRDRTFDWLFREMGKRFVSPQIVETGCIRAVDDWSGGYSTWLFERYILGQDAGELVSVDNDPEHAEFARSQLESFQTHAPSRVRLIESDSVAYLRSRTEPIDVAYLDSLDCEQEGHAEHCLAEAKAVVPLMTPRGLIVIDDSPQSGEDWIGKGRLAIPWLLSQGWQLLPESGYQAILSRD